MIPRREIPWNRQTFLAVGLAAMIPLLLFTRVLAVVRVEGLSMAPGLLNRDRLIVLRPGFFFTDYRRFDIVVFAPPPGQGHGPMIKRIIGLPGETVSIEDGRFLVNHRPLDISDAGAAPPQADMGAFRVPADHCFVLGDNRNESRDSRVFGTVPLQSIIGRVFVRYWPLLRRSGPA